MASLCCVFYPSRGLSGGTIRGGVNDFDALISLRSWIFPIGSPFDLRAFVLSNENIDLLPVSTVRFFVLFVFTLWQGAETL